MSGNQPKETRNDQQEVRLDTIPAAIEEIRKGKPVIVLTGGLVSSKIIVAPIKGIFEFLSFFHSKTYTVNRLILYAQGNLELNHLF